MESVLSLQHIFRVAKAVNVDPLIGLEGGVAYLVNEEHVKVVAETWTLAFDDPPPLTIALVDGLPRGALVEWHIIRCRKRSDVPKTTKFSMAWTNSEISLAIHNFRGEYGVLCIVFGRLQFVREMKSRYKHVAIQSIPCKGIYSTGIDGIKSRDLCTIVLA